MHNDTAVSLLALIPKEKVISQNIGKVADNCVHLEPVLFPKWRYFERELGCGVGIAFLILTAFYCNHGEDPEEDRYTVIRECFEGLENAISHYFYVKNDKNEFKNYTKWYGVDAEKSLDAWVKVIRQDSDLKNYFLNYLDFLYLEAENRLNWGQFLKQGPDYALKWLDVQSYY